MGVVLTEPTRGAAAVRRALVLAAILVAVSLGMSAVPADAASYVQRTVRVSGTALTPTDAGSYWGAVSSKALHVAFQSHASNLPGGGASADVFVRDTRSASTRCVSVALDGAAADGPSGSPSISANGQMIAFQSYAANLVAGDTNGSWDVFCRNMNGSAAVPVSISTQGEPGLGDSSQPALSADGRWVAFVSAAANLVAGDTAGYDDVFIRDLVAGTTIRLTRGMLGAEANGHSSAPSISADGRRVAFVSHASNLAPGDTNGARDVFVVDVATMSTVRASVRGAGTQANLGSTAPSISGSGQRVAFESLATNLVSKDTNGVRDVFVRDLMTQTTVRASMSSLGKQGTAESREPSLSYDGRKVAFSSPAGNLVAKDTNGLSDIFVRTLSDGKTTRRSVVGSSQVKSSCGGPVFSSDGSRLVYHTGASNLVAGDANKSSDVFLSAWGKRRYERIQGSSVWATAVQASRRAAPHGAPAVVVVNGSDWRAALAGSSLAGTVKGPILYVSKDSLPAVTRDEIVRLGARRVYLVGGEGAVSSAVAGDLASIVGPTAVERVGSGDGYSVAKAVASRVVGLKGSGFSGTVLVVSGKSYTSSVAAVPLAAGVGRPIVFVNPATGSYALPANTKKAIIIGGSGSVSRSAEAKLKRKLGSSRVSRIAGSDRYATARAVAGKTVSFRHTWDGVTMVNIARPTEAICGAVMAGRIGSVVLYTSKGSLPSASRDRLVLSRYRIDKVYVLGTTGSVGASTLSAIKRALGG